MKYFFSLRTILFLSTAILAILLIIACIGAYLRVSFLPALAFFSLVLPLLVLGNLFFAIYWLIKWNKLVFLSLVSLGISYFVFGSFFNFSKRSDSPTPEDLTIMTFNTGNFDDYKKGNSGEGNPLSTFLKEEDPDILCVQETNKARHKYLKQYPYRYVTPNSSFKSTQGIFSKYPIIAEGSLDFPDTANNAIYADIVYKKDTIRIYNLHLQSFKILPGRIKRSKNPFRFYGRMETTFIKQEGQALFFQEHFQNAPYQKVVCADLNNTPFSSVYRLVKEDLRDTFEEKGSGLGMTYDINIVPFRIDFIFVDKNMKVKTHQNFKIRLSDHEPVLSSIQL